MYRSEKVFVFTDDNKFADLKGAAVFFSTAGEGIWSRWVDDRVCEIFRFLNRPEPRRPLRLEYKDSESFNRLMPCYKNISTLIGLINDLSARFPEVIAVAELMKVHLRRFFECVEHFVIVEDDCYGSGDSGSLDDIKAQLRDAGDAFAASIIGYEVNRKESENPGVAKAADSVGQSHKDISHKDIVMRKFYDAVVIAYIERECGSTIERAIKDVVKNISWVKDASVFKNSRTGNLNNVSAIKQTLGRWLRDGQDSGYEDVGELPKSFKKGEGSRMKLRRYYEHLKGLDKSEPLKDS